MVNNLKEHSAHTPTKPSNNNLIEELFHREDSMAVNKPQQPGVVRFMGQIVNISRRSSVLEQLSHKDSIQTKEILDSLQDPINAEQVPEARGKSMMSHHRKTVLMNGAGAHSFIHELADSPFLRG